MGDSVRGRNNLGTSLLGRLQDSVAADCIGCADEAHALFMSLLHRDVNDEFAMMNLGSLERMRGNTADSVAWFERIVTMIPEHAEAHLKLATHWHRQGHLSHAMKHYNQAMASGPVVTDLHNNLALAYVNM